MDFSCRAASGNYFERDRCRTDRHVAAVAACWLYARVSASFALWSHLAVPTFAGALPRHQFSHRSLMTIAHPTQVLRRANKALVPTAGADLSSMLSAARTRHPFSTPTSAPTVGTACVRLRKRTFLAGMDFNSLLQKIVLIFLLCAASCRAELYYPTDDASWQTATAAVAGSDPVLLADAVNLWLSLVGELRRYQRPTPAALRRGATFGSAESRRAAGSVTARPGKTIRSSLLSPHSTSSS